MEHYSIIDRSAVDRPVVERPNSDRISPRLGVDPELEASELEPELELDVAHGGVGGSVNPSVSSPSVSAGIAAANALAAAGTAGEAGWRVDPRFPGGGGGHSMGGRGQHAMDRTR